MLLMVGSTIGFTVTKHICGGRVVLTAITLTQQDLTCGMKKYESSCPMHQKKSEPCCSNEHELHQLDDNYQHPVVLPVSPFVLEIPFQLFNQNVNVFEAEKKVSFCFESPPEIIKDFSILYQSILI